MIFVPDDVKVAPPNATIEELLALGLITYSEAEEDWAIKAAVREAIDRLKQKGLYDETLHTSK